jgi:hypothetical protein
MKLRWWVVGFVAVAAGGIVMMKHLVEPKKSFLPYSDKSNENNAGKFSHELLDTELDEINFIA